MDNKALIEEARPAPLDDVEALLAENEKFRAALTLIVSWMPATQDVTLAHDMAAEAAFALAGDK